jgi:Signal transduction histidine kinase
MGLPKSLRFRFALWSTVFVFAAVSLYGAFVFFTMDYFLHASTRESLRLSAEQISASLEVESGLIQSPEHLWEASNERAGHGLAAVRVVDRNGTPIVREGWAEPRLPRISEGYSKSGYRLVEPDLATLSLPIVKGGAQVGFVQVAQSTEALERMLKTLLLVLAFSLPIFLFGSAASGYFLATRLLKPIDVMTRTARRISEEDLSARIDLPPSDDELGRLAATFDEMLERLDGSFTRYRQFTADASHELRTPVAVINAILEVTKRRPRTVEEYQAAMRDLESAAGRLESLVSALMTLSRSDMGAPASMVDVGDLLLGSVDSLRPLAEEKGLSISMDIAPGLAMLGDSDALVQVFINVIGNAIKYTSRGQVAVSAVDCGGEIRIEVRDSGIGIEAAELPRIFDRFYRVERSRSADGFGLGLAIARAIVERHRGSIEAESELGVGTIVRILLPKNNRRA